MFPHGKWERVIPSKSAAKCKLQLAVQYAITLVIKDINSAHIVARLWRIERWNLDIRE